MGVKKVPKPLVGALVDGGPASQSARGANELDPAEKDLAQEGAELDARWAPPEASPAASLELRARERTTTRRSRAPADSKAAALPLFAPRPPG